jgi:hypothetical protein
MHAKAHDESQQRRHGLSLQCASPLIRWLRYRLPVGVGEEPPVPGDRSHSREPVRVGIRQRLEQQRVDDAEDGGVGADADGERDDDHQRQRGGAPQSPDGVAEVLQEGSH